MKSKGFTQKALSAVSGIRQVSISEYLNAKTIPNAESLCSLASALGVSMDWLWGLDSGEKGSLAPTTNTPTARETLLESKLRMATSALESILKELKKK
ncbi:MAG: helix-turn-helix transcriptional regulator [Akkermansia sp.]|nr:helix-turn-helix transcriptional regulator [Akkermansia sp.]